MGKITKIFGSHDQNTLTQLDDIASRAEMVALMADGHYGYVMPVGGVAAYDNLISVVGVGFDIACGNAAIRTNRKLSDITDGKLTLEEVKSNPFRLTQDRNIIAIANEIHNTISFGIGRKNNADDAPVDHPLFLDPAWYAIPNVGRFRDDLRDKAQRQLGTVGSGNHYVDVFVAENEDVWVGVHFGSRGFGHTIASNFLNLSQGLDWGMRGAKEKEVLLDLSDPMGHDYWNLMNLAGDYAYAGREWVARKVVQILGGEEVELVHNHHNFAWKEHHGGREFVVIRKGATPAFPGQKGFVGGSMGDNAVILQGRRQPPDTQIGTPWDDSFDSELYNLQKNALYSTVHGAGRVMSRTEAAGKWDYKKKVRKTVGKISKEMMTSWLAKEGVVLRGGGLDEAPQAYRRLPDVLAAQGKTVEVLHTLKPLIVVMAGEEEFDPYKD